jgi:hypothetical protein
MVGFFIMIISAIFGLGVWLFCMRPHLVKRRRSPVTGASFGLGAWGDWQECRGLAKTTQDRRASKLAVVFMISQIGFLIGLIVLILSL